MVNSDSLKIRPWLTDFILNLWNQLLCRKKTCLMFPSEALANHHPSKMGTCLSSVWAARSIFHTFDIKATEVVIKCSPLTIHKPIKLNVKTCEYDKQGKGKQWLSGERQYWKVTGHFLYQQNFCFEEKARHVKLNSTWTGGGATDIKNIDTGYLRGQKTVQRSRKINTKKAEYRFKL